MGQEKDFFIDQRDGNKYTLVHLGKNIWMAENLNYSQDIISWSAKSKNKKKLGQFYTWETAKKVCPNGWHLPSEKDWNELIDFVGGDSVAGGKLKSSAIWKKPNEGVEHDSINFDALPAGYRCFYDETIHGYQYFAYFWSSTRKTNKYAETIYIDYNEKNIIRSFDSRLNGLSVRCVKN